MKKVLIYINQICLRGGVEKVFYNLINNLDKDKYDITVLTTVAYLSDDLKVDIYKGRIKRFFFYYDEFSDKFLYRQFQRIYNKIAHPIIDFIIKHKKWDIAIAAQEGMYAKYIQNVFARKKLLWIHNDMNLINTKCFASLLKEKECYETFDHVVCVSNDVKNSMINKFGDMQNLCVCYNPIDTFEIDIKKNEKIDIQRKIDIPLFVSVGRLCEQKGYDRLLKSVIKLNSAGYKYEIWIIGDGVLRNEIESTIKDNNINNVKLLGHKTNPYSYMTQADWIICTSRHEGFNMVLHEATYLEKPIFTTKNAGAVELLGDSEYGIVINNDDNEIYNAFKELLDNKELTAKYKTQITKRKDFISLKNRISNIEQIL